MKKLVLFNKALIGSLTWKVMGMDSFAIFFLRTRILGKIHYVGSSIWPEVISSLDVIYPNCSWIIGQNSQFHFLSGNWLG